MVGVVVVVVDVDGPEMRQVVAWRGAACGREGMNGWAGWLADTDADAGECAFV